MRKFVIIALLLLVSVMPVSAFSPRDSYLGTNLTAIAWYDGKELNVAVANASSARTTISISTPTVDSWGRQVFASQRIDLLGQSLIQQTFYPAAPRRNEKIVVEIGEGYRTVDIPVQYIDIMNPDSYIVQSNTQVNVAVDLDFLLKDSGRIRLIVDDYYQTDSGYNQDRIRISSLSGGLEQVRGNSNTIEFAKPSMVLSMRAPQTNDVMIMTFEVRKTDGSSWRDEIIQGPMVLVYGRNIRFTSSPSSSDRISR